MAKTYFVEVDSRNLVTRFMENTSRGLVYTEIIFSLLILAGIATIFIMSANTINTIMLLQDMMEPASDILSTSDIATITLQAAQIKSQMQYAQTTAANASTGITAAQTLLGTVAQAVTPTESQSSFILGNWVLKSLTSPNRLYIYPVTGSSSSPTIAFNSVAGSYGTGGIIYRLNSPGVQYLASNYLCSRAGGAKVHTNSAAVWNGDNGLFFYSTSASPNTMYATTQQTVNGW